MLVIDRTDISRLDSARIRSERQLSPMLAKGCVEFQLAC